MKKEQFNTSRKNFYNEYGDIFTLLKAYQMYRQKEKEYNSKWKKVCNNKKKV